MYRPLSGSYPTPRTSSDTPFPGFNLDNAMDDISRGTAGDASLNPTNFKPEPNAKAVNDYYRDAFAVREPERQPRDIVLRGAPIIAELKTNVIIQDEYTFITQLSNHLAQHYERSESCISICLNHSACFMLGGSFDPAAIFEISTVAASVSPAVNRRVVALTSIWLNDNLQVEPSRAIIKFEALPEANLGIGAQTIAGEIDNMEKHMGMEGSGHKRKLSTLSRRGSWFRPPSRKNSIDDRGDPRQYLGFTPIASPISPPPIAPASPPQTAPAGPEKDGLLMKAKKRKNLASIFKR